MAPPLARSLKEKTPAVTVLGDWSPRGNQGWEDIALSTRSPFQPLCPIEPPPDIVSVVAVP